MNATLFSGPEALLLAEEQHRALALARMGEAPAPASYGLQGNVAAIDISGSLVSGSAGMMSYFGYTGYHDIQQQLVAAVADPAVGSILLNVDSGGGHVAGVHELAQLIARVDKIKPVVTYTGGTMGSAALWLGSSARKVFASSTAMVGSLGILQVHIDRTEQLAKEGVKATVIRAGESKALANPYEPLSEKARADLQAQADEMYGVFLGHVAEQRKLSAASAEKQFGGGKVFVGKQAEAANLADQVGGYSLAFAEATKLAGSYLSKNAKVPSRQPQRINASSTIDSIDPKQGPQMHEDLSPEALAALAGVDLSGDVPDADDSSASADAEAAQAEAATAKAELEAAKAELATAQAELASAKSSLEAAQATLATQAPQFDAAISIARASVRTMGLHFDVSADAVAAMSAEAVLEQHAALAEKFRAKFKVKAGGVAAASVDQQPVQVKPALVDPLFAARVNRHQ